MKRLVKRLVGTPSSGACPKCRTRGVREASVLPPSRDPACFPPHETLSRCAAGGRRMFLARRVHTTRNTRPALPQQQQHHRARAQRFCRSAARRASPTAPPAWRARASSSAAWRGGGARVRRGPGQPGLDAWAKCYCNLRTKAEAATPSSTLPPSGEFHFVRESRLVRCLPSHHHV
jgi:hypothetical protein